MKTITPEELKKLYEKDFALWVEKNLELLREKAYELVDWENLLEEIEHMAKSELEACISQLARILEHLYKYEYLKPLTYGKEKGGYSWIKSIENAREKIYRKFDLYPSLKGKLPEYMPVAWKWARRELLRWLEKNRISHELPHECPYTFKQAMEYAPWKK